MNMWRLLTKAPIKLINGRYSSIVKLIYNWIQETIFSIYTIFCFSDRYTCGQKNSVLYVHDVVIIHMKSDIPATHVHYTVTEQYRFLVLFIFYFTFTFFKVH
jgi:hypothetical protein